MKKITNLNQLPDPIRIKAIAVRKNHERDLYPVREISDWKGLTRAERSLLIDIRKGQRERTSLKGSKGWMATTIEQLAEENGYSTKQVSRILRSLEGKHIIERKLIRMKGKGKPRGPGSGIALAIHKQAACFRKGESPQETAP